MLDTVNSERPKNLRNAIVGTFLLANAFVWYLTAFNLLQEAINSKVYSSDIFQLLIGLNFLAFILSAFFATFIIEKIVDRKIYLKYWIIAGLLVSALFALILTADYSILLLIGILSGAYFGLGMPIAAGYFAACTEPRNRAKFGGALILLIVIPYEMLSVLSSSQTYLGPVVLMTWLIVGLFLLNYKGPGSRAEPSKKISYASIFQNRTFLLYLVPWLMFSLINELTSLVIKDSFSEFFLQDYIIFTNVIAGICAIVFGFIADKKGRKRLALVGFALLGIGYATLGLFPQNYGVAWFYVCVDGIAWGAFTMLFIATLWGDIAQDNHAEKYYLIGVLPYLLSIFTGDSLGTFLAQNNLVSEQTVFSFAAFFLFMATLPLFYAPETLPEKVLKEMDLTSYIEKAKKKVGENVRKSSKEEGTTEREENHKSTKKEENNYEEAKKIAEKYY